MCTKTNALSSLWETTGCHHTVQHSIRCNDTNRPGSAVSLPQTSQNLHLSDSVDIAHSQYNIRRRIADVSHGRPIRADFEATTGSAGVAGAVAHKDTELSLQRV
jgi:hypothetical protein